MSKISVLPQIQKIHDEMKSWRHELHKHPETSYTEFYASDFVKTKLKEMGIRFESDIAGTGVVGIIEGKKNTSGRGIGLRADLDALEIIEQTGLPYASCNHGKMHACGHDGHTTVLLGAAKYLNETKNFDGTVYLIFQPAEEEGCGADRMIDEGLFKRFPCNAVFGLHNWPWMPLGKIGMRVGPIMAAVDYFKIKITGKEGHAAVPQSFNDPIVAASQIVTALQTIVSRMNPIESAIVSITNFNAGTGAINIIPREANLSGTIRTLSNEVQPQIKKRFYEIIENISNAFNVKCEIEYIVESCATVNTKNEIQISAEVAKEIVGAENVDTETVPYMTGEDFGAMLRVVPGTYIYLGQGTEDKTHHNSRALHHSEYDFNDDALTIGASYYARLAEKFLPL